MQMDKRCMRTKNIACKFCGICDMYTKKFLYFEDCIFIPNYIF